MRLSHFLLVLIPGAFVCSSVSGMFMFDQTKQVPISRLFTNLQQRLAHNTNDFNLTYQLARVHSMSYATNVAEISVSEKEGTPVFGYPGSDAGVPMQVQVFKTAEAKRTALQHLTNAIALYERALVLLKKSTNVNEQSWMILPTHLGLAWCLDQSGQRDKALAAYRTTLKIAWKMEVVGEFSFKEWASGVWDDVRAGKNPIHNRRQGHIGPGVCFSQEVIGYMLKLLDVTKNAKEIAELKEREKTLNSMGRAITPILVSLEPDAAFTELVDANASVKFDLDGSGLPRKWGWITPKAAWLVYDSDGRGEITSALQMFGNVTFWIFWRDGYAALSALDDDLDGILRGPELRGLALWQDGNNNGVSDPGEVRPVEQYGIVTISTENQSFTNEMKWNPCGIAFEDGTTRPTYDWISPSK